MLFVKSTPVSQELYLAASLFKGLLDFAEMEAAPTRAG